MEIKYHNRVENIVRKGEIPFYKQKNPFLTMFSTAICIVDQNAVLSHNGLYNISC